MVSLDYALAIAQVTMIVPMVWLAEVCLANCQAKLSETGIVGWPFDK